MLNFYLEPMLAAWADYSMLSLFLWQTKVVFAGRALSVNVCSFIELLAFLQIDKLLRSVGKFDKFLVFLLSFVNIS